MAKWTIIREGETTGQVYKDGVAYENLDISWLPADIRAVQSQSGSDAWVEYSSEQKYVQDVTSEVWWGNVSVVWQHRHDNPPVVESR